MPVPHLPPPPPSTILGPVFMSYHNQSTQIIKWFWHNWNEPTFIKKNNWKKLNKISKTHFKVIGTFFPWRSYLFIYFYVKTTYLHVPFAKSKWPPSLFILGCVEFHVNFSSFFFLTWSILFWQPSVTKPNRTALIFQPMRGLWNNLIQPSLTSPNKDILFIFHNP